MPIAMVQRPFTAAEDRQILHWRALGMTFDALAHRLCRSGASCRGRYNDLAHALDQQLIQESTVSGGDAAKPKRQRICMCCRQPFWSTGSGNRLCAACKHRSIDEPY